MRQRLVLPLTVHGNIGDKFYSIFNNSTCRYRTVKYFLVILPSVIRQTITNTFTVNVLS